MFSWTRVRAILPALGIMMLLGASASLRAATAVVSADTSITQATPNGNFGALGTVNIGPGNAGLIQFDLSPLQSLGLTAANIQKATMTFYVNRVITSGKLDFALTNQNWGESTATYNNFNQGLIGAPFVSGIAVTTGGTFITIDITQQVKDWVTGVVVNNGIIVKPSATDPNTTVFLDSKESTTTSEPATLSLILASSGPAGPSGPSGPSGPAGASGPSGPAGPSGATGPSGPAGASGASGPSGPAGPSGATGPSGPAGASGASGPSGPAGPSGATGPSGPAGASGASGPSGPAGPSGATGSSGPAGASGPSGPSGPAGPSGATGSSGPAGASGPSGPQGPTGPMGIQGPSGPAGTSGPSGPQGPSGPSGPAGGGGNLFGQMTQQASPRFVLPMTNVHADAATEVITLVRFTQGCTFSGLRVDSAGTAGAVNMTSAATVGLRVNGTNQLTCNMGVGASSCTSAATFTINAGDLVNWTASGYATNASAILRFSGRCQ